MHWMGKPKPTQALVYGLGTYLARLVDNDRSGQATVPPNNRATRQEASLTNEGTGNAAQ